MELCPFPILDPCIRLASQRVRAGQGLEPRGLLFKSVLACSLASFPF